VGKSPIQQPIDEHDQHADRHGKSPKLESYFRAMVKADASDLHLKANSPASVRISTAIRPSRAEILSGDDILEMAYEIMTDKQRAFYEDHGSIDLAHELEGSDRFRINVFRQRGEISVSVRRVTKDIPDFRTLNLPPIVERISEYHQGLVLLAGPTGCGKSTTIAAMLEHINKTRPCHIVTIEDPIEYIYVDKKALVSQREIGIDVESFEFGLKYLMRQDPDVILIGEMRDRETFQAALQASETGHLVFGTIHASGAANTVGRILDLFPVEGRNRVRQSLAFNLRAVICQKLLPCLTEDIDRIPATEIMIANPSVRQLISEERDPEINEVIRSNEVEGMHSFTASLLELIEADRIDPRVAYEHASNVEELKMAMKGISASRSGLLGR
jgi:twitching motility protein PilT